MAAFNLQIIFLWPFSMLRSPHFMAIFSAHITPFSGHFQCTDYPILWPFSMHRSPHFMNIFSTQITSFYGHFQWADQCGAAAAAAGGRRTGRGRDCMWSVWSVRPGGSPSSLWWMWPGVSLDLRQEYSSVCQTFRVWTVQFCYKLNA